MTADILVVIQTVPSRAASLAVLREQLEASDVGTDYHIAYKNCGEHVDDPDATEAVSGMGEHFPTLLRWMGKQERSLAIYLEDDARVNRHLLHNVRTWDALNEPDFGAGWLFVPRNVYRDATRLRPTARGNVYRMPRGTEAPMFMSAALLFRAGHTAELAQRFEVINPAGNTFDIAVAQAAQWSGRRCYLHAPPLAEHDLSVGSSLGHGLSAPHHSTMGLFNPDWRRGGLADDILAARKLFHSRLVPGPRTRLARA